MPAMPAMPALTAPWPASVTPANLHVDAGWMTGAVLMLPVPAVLIVDDHHDLRRTVRWVLEEVARTDPEYREYVVAEAADGQQALDVLRAGTAPTVVLFDLCMPVMDGQQLVRHILADPVLATRCTLVCMTASVISLSPDLAVLLEAHDIPVLAKPYHTDDLLAVVAAAADKLPA